jgi:hypothetical protein
MLVKTDDLIDLLAQDSARPWGLRSLLAMALAAGITIAAILFFVGIGFRPDLSEAAKSTRFLFKFVVTVSLAVTAIWVTLSVGRPGGSLARRGAALAIAPALLAAAAVVELLVLPDGQWIPRLVGHNARFCLTLIPLLSIGPLACLLAALREGAPSSPGLAGAVAGLAASGIAATFYAANCTDDSALFVITWYPIAILIVTTAGYLLGRKLLRW